MARTKGAPTGRPTNVLSKGATKATRRTRLPLYKLPPKALPKSKRKTESSIKRTKLSQNCQPVDSNCGIRATGKNCYANVVIQLMNSCQELKAAIVALHAPPQSPTGILVTIFELLDAMDNNISSEALVAAAGFDNTQEEDVAEMYQRLARAADDEVINQRIQDLLMWRSSYSIECAVHKPSIRRENKDSGYIIILPIKDNATLLDAVQDYKRDPIQWQ